VFVGADLVDERLSEVLAKRGVKASPLLGGDELSASRLRPTSSRMRSVQ